MSVGIGITLLLVAYSRLDIALIAKEFQTGSLIHYTFGIVEFLSSLIVSLSMFSYLHKKKGNDFFHSLPAGKKELFQGSLISGLLIYVLPWTVLVLLTLPILALRVGGELPMLFLQYGIYRLALYVIFYGIDVFAMVLCGRGFIALLCGILFHFLSPLTSLFLEILEGTSLYGISLLSPPYYTSPIFYLGSLTVSTDSTSPWVAVGIYVGVSVLIMLLSYLLYKKRREEAVGAGVVFSPLLTVAQWFLTPVILYIFLLVLDSSFLYYRFDINPWVLASLSLPAFLLCRMMLMKSRKILQKKTLLHCGIFALCLLSLTLMIQHDTLGIVHRVPKGENVQGLHLSVEGLELSTEDREDIEEFRQLHKELLDHWDATSESDRFVLLYLNYNSTVDLTYDLKGQPSMHRSYSLAEKSPYVHNLLQYILEGERGLTVLQKLRDRSPTFDTSDGTLSTAQADRLLAAMEQDIREGNMPLSIGDTGYLLWINHSDGSGDSYFFHISPSAEHTYAVYRDLIT